MRVVLAKHVFKCMKSQAAVARVELGWRGFADTRRSKPRDFAAINNPANHTLATPLCTIIVSHCILCTRAACEVHIYATATLHDCLNSVYFINYIQIRLIFLFSIQLLQTKEPFKVHSISILLHGCCLMNTACFSCGWERFILQNL